MEQTLGKRIAAHRKRLGLTQEKLAERLGVTAQAVSKWENDQACPDIAMLPRLAEIFGATTDELLGIERKVVHHAEVVEEEDHDGIHIENGKWEFKWDGGRKHHLGFAVWVLLAGGLLLLSNVMEWGAGLWDIAWPAAILVFGLWGIFPGLSFFRLGCALFGGYTLLDHLNVPLFDVGSELLLPICILLFGMSLLADAFRKQKKPTFRVVHNGGNSDKTKSECYNTADSFHCVQCFGENHHRVDVPVLRSGKADLRFGELTVDLRDCQEIADGCTIDAGCAFGELCFLVPRRFTVRHTASTAFASVDVDGHPDPEPEGIITMDARVHFGEISIEYV